MRWFAALWVVAGLGLARAEDGDTDVDVGDTVSGRRPSTTVEEISGVPDPSAFEKELASYAGRPLEPIAYYGAKVLGLDPEFISVGRVGTELLYKRNYKAAKAHFEMMGTKWRGYGLGPLGQVLVWQAMMMENFDFRYESQYQTAYRLGRQEVEEALQSPGNQAWEYFVLGGLLGVDSIHTMRHEDYLVALNRGYEAMKAVKHCQELAPAFTDTLLGDGLFNYWVTVISMSSKLLPNVGDHRKEGLGQMAQVEQQGIFLRPAATLSLAFSWVEEGKYKDALASTGKNRAAYPENVINNLVHARVQMYVRAYSSSEATLLGVLATAPENLRAHYYLGRLYQRWGKLDQSIASFKKYLAFTDISKEDRALTQYFLAGAYSRKRDYNNAEYWYREAWKVGKLDRAKDRLQSLQERKAAQ